MTTSSNSSILQVICSDDFIDFQTEEDEESVKRLLCEQDVEALQEDALNFIDWDNVIHEVNECCDLLPLTSADLRDFFLFRLPATTLPSL